MESAEGYSTISFYSGGGAGGGSTTYTSYFSSTSSAVSGGGAGAGAGDAIDSSTLRATGTFSNKGRGRVWLILV